VVFMQNPRVSTTWCCASFVADLPGSPAGDPMVNVPAAMAAYPAGQDPVHAPLVHVGVLPEHTAQPAGDDDVPQWFSSVDEQLQHRPPVPQYLPVPHDASATHTQPPSRHDGAAPEHCTQPAGDEPVPQRAASVAEQSRQVPPSQYRPAPQSACPPHAQAPDWHDGVDPEHCAHPGADAAVPQCAASLGRHARHSPDAEQ